MRSSVSSGALITPATQSPESPRRTETSPFIKLILATPRLRSSGSCARAVVKKPAVNKSVPVKAKNRNVEVRPMMLSPELRPLSCNANTKQHHPYYQLVRVSGRLRTVAENHHPGRDGACLYRATIRLVPRKTRRRCQIGRAH